MTTSPPSSETIYSWVQKMNNSAALCLQIGQYERAIKSLAKALQLSRSFIEGSTNNEDTNSSNANSSFCECQFLSLDQCIHYSEDYIRNCNIHRKLRVTDSRGNISDNRSEESIRRRFLQRRQDRRNRMGVEQHNSTDNQVFLYQELIQVPDLSQHAQHDVHSKQIMVLSLISIFNLAIVCHLRAMDQISKIGLNRQANTDLTKALKLYEVAYNALAKQNNVHDDSVRSSAQFKLILCNNLSHVHQLTGNKSEQERYLHEVLSVTMSLVDSNNRPWNNDNSGDIISSSEDAQNNFQRRQPKCIDLEGFLANAAPLLTENVCADAA